MGEKTIPTGTRPVEGDGLRGPDKQQAAERDIDRREEHDDRDPTPEGLRRRRLGPYDKAAGRAGPAGGEVRKLDDKPDEE